MSDDLSPDYGQCEMPGCECLADVLVEDLNIPGLDLWVCDSCADKMGAVWEWPPVATGDDDG